MPSTSKDPERHGRRHRMTCQQYSVLFYSSAQNCLSLVLLLLHQYFVEEQQQQKVQCALMLLVVIIFTLNTLKARSSSADLPICTALHCTALHCTALHCTALPCPALHCTALQICLQAQSVHSRVQGQAHSLACLLASSVGKQVVVVVCRNVRTSQGTFISSHEDGEGVLAWIENRLSQLTGLPVDHGEVRLPPPANTIAATFKTNTTTRKALVPIVVVVYCNCYHFYCCCLQW